METDFKSPGKEESSSLDERNHWSVLNNLLKIYKVGCTTSSLQARARTLWGSSHETGVRGTVVGRIVNGFPGDVQVLIPGTYKCYLIWQEGLCSSD